MIRFSANLGFLWPDRPLLARIEAAAAAGFGAVELHWPDVPAAAVRAACERHGLALLGINTPRGDAARGEFGLGAVPGREAEFQAGVDRALAFCAEAGASHLHCMAGLVPPEIRAAGRATFADNLGRAADKAARHGVTLLLEPLNAADAPGYFYGTTAEAVALLTDLGRPDIRLMFDCYHVGRTEGAVADRLERLLPLVGHVQIAAVPTRAEPDGGTLDYRAVFDRLDAHAYPGWIGCEYKPAGDTDAGLGWIPRLGAGSGLRPAVDTPRPPSISDQPAPSGRGGVAQVARAAES